ncbi:MAG: hypothetical protein KDF55_14495 [Thauera sp.]|nr:hypothetical protein [Thauera sp.]
MSENSALPATTSSARSPWWGVWPAGRWTALAAQGFFAAHGFFAAQGFFAPQAAFGEQGFAARDERVPAAQGFACATAAIGKPSMAPTRPAESKAWLVRWWVWRFMVVSSRTNFQDQSANRRRCDGS